MCKLSCKFKTHTLTNRTMKSILSMRKSLLNGILISLLLAGVFVYLYAVIEPILHFHMQQNPFYTSGHFLRLNLERVGGMGLYLSNFLMQNFHSNLKGSLTVILLISILPLSLAIILRNLKVRFPLFILYVPVVLATALFHDYFFPLTILVQILVLYLAVMFYSFLFKRISYSIVAALLLYGLLYYIFGSGTALIFGLTCLLLNLFQHDVKQQITGSITSLVMITLLPFLAYKFFFNLSPSQAFFQFLPELPVTLGYQKTVLIYIFNGSLPLLLILGKLISIFKIPKRLIEISDHKAFQLAGNLVLLVIGFWLMNLPANAHAKNIAKVDFLTYNQQWEKAKSLALEEKAYDFLNNLNFNRSIHKTGKLLEQFFDYPQLLGIKALTPDNLGTAFYSIQASEYYFDLNYIIRSQHLAYAALVLEPYNARVLKQLVLTNLVLGNSWAAQTYLNVLAGNPLYKSFVEKYLPFVHNPDKIKEDQLLSAKRKSNPDNFAIPLHITNRLEDLIAKDSSNQTAWEHLQLCYMLDHRLDDFMSHFQGSMQFYQTIPALYEQALLVYIYSTRSNLELSRSISNASKDKFTAFLQKLKDYNNNLDVAREHLADFENSYIYYMKYQSPRVTNVEIITNK